MRGARAARRGAARGDAARLVGEPGAAGASRAGRRTCATRAPGARRPAALAARSRGRAPGAARRGLHDRAGDAAGARARASRDAVVVWLDAHGDFNTPATSGSGYLGGMRSPRPAGAGTAGSARGSTRARVVLGDARDLDPAEREELDRAGVRRVALGGRRRRGPRRARLPPPRPRRARPVGDGGRGARPRAAPTLDELAAALRDLAAAATIVGVEVTAFDDPEPERLAGPVGATRSGRGARIVGARRAVHVASPPGKWNELRHGHRHGRIRVGRRSGAPGGGARRGLGRPAAPRERASPAGGTPGEAVPARSRRRGPRSRALDVEVHLHAEPGRARRGAVRGGRARRRGADRRRQQGHRRALRALAARDRRAGAAAGALPGARRRHRALLARGRRGEERPRAGAGSRASGRSSSSRPSRSSWPSST